jgi:hypothetical protein
MVFKLGPQYKDKKALIISIIVFFIGILGMYSPNKNFQIAGFTLCFISILYMIARGYML